MIKKTIYILILLATVAAVVFAALDRRNTHSLLPLDNKNVSEESMQIEAADTLDTLAAPEIKD